MSQTTQDDFLIIDDSVEPSGGLLTLGESDTGSENTAESSLDFSFLEDNQETQQTSVADPLAETQKTDDSSDISFDIGEKLGALSENIQPQTTSEEENLDVSDNLQNIQVIEDISDTKDDTSEAKVLFDNVFEKSDDNQEKKSEDFFQNVSEKNDIQISQQNDLQNIEENFLDTGNENGESINTKKENSFQEQNQSMDMILADTISKLESREKNIQSKKTQKLEQIESLEAEISELQSQVQQANSVVKDLEDESKSIQINIEKLESMKMQAVTEPHNKKRIPKK